MIVRVQITKEGESAIFIPSKGYVVHIGCEDFVCYSLCYSPRMCGLKDVIIYNNMETLSNVSYLKDVLYCKKCNLRVHIPKDLSWSDQIAYFKKALSLDILECPRCDSMHYLTSEHIGQKCMLPDFGFSIPRNCDGILQRKGGIIPPIV